MPVAIVERPGSPWISVLGLAAICGAVFAVIDPFKDLDSLDGSLYYFAVQSHLDWGRPFDSAVTNVFQGVVTQFIPMNVWANPAFIPFGFFSPMTALFVGKATVFAIYVCATYVLARALGGGVVASVLAAQCVGIFSASPFSTEIGIPDHFSVNASSIYIVAVLLFVYVLLLGTRIVRWSATIAAGVAAAGLAWYAIYCDVLWTTVHILTFGLFAAVAAVSEVTRSRLYSRLVFFAVVLGVLYVTGALEYMLNVIRYAARVNFLTEIYGEIQDFTFASYSFRGPAAGGRATLAWIFVGLGSVLGWRLGNGRIRMLSIACLAHLGSLSILTLVYVYSDLNWTYPMPFYLDIAAYPFYGVAAFLGWGKACERIRGGREKAGAATGWGAYGFVLLVPLAVVLVVDREQSPIPRSAERTKIIDHLSEQIAIRPGEPFRGSVVSIIGVGDEPFDKWKYSEALQEIQTSFGNMHALSYLWRENIPTLEEYSQLISPQLYFLISRVLSRPGDFHSRNLGLITHAEPKVLRTLGVRYVLTDNPGDLPGATRVMEISGEGPRKLTLFELERANTGWFSPTNPLVARTALESLDLMQHDDFDPTVDVVVEEPIAEQLSPARDVLLRFDTQELRLTAHSEGTSLLVLPVQYTACWKIHPSPLARIVRTDFMLAGVLFSGVLDATITSSA